MLSFASTQIPNTVVVVHITNVRHNSDYYKTDVMDLCQRHLSKQQVTFQRFLNASSALVLAMKFDNFITLFYLMVTNALVHLFTLWYPTALYTKLHNGSDPPCTPNYLVVLEGLNCSASLLNSLNQKSFYKSNLHSGWDVLLNV